MCIGFPGKVLSISEDGFALIDVNGVRREACLDLVDQEIAVGDYVLCHAGYAIHRLDEAVALEKLEFLRELIRNEIY